MDNQSPPALVTAIGTILSEGLPQDAAVDHFIASTLGPLSAGELTALLADRDDPQTASLVELLLFPGQAVALSLEPLFAAARLAPGDGPALARAVAATTASAVAVMPDGTRLTLPVTSDDLERFVDRLAPGRNLPPTLSALVAERFGPEVGPELAVAARQTGPDNWTAARSAFMETLLTRLDTAHPRAEGTVRYLWRFLAGLPVDKAPLPGLSARRLQLTAQLRRADRQDQALAGSNFETLIMAGARLPYLHRPDIAAELALVDTALLAVTGRLPDSAEGVCWDMGTVGDTGELLAAMADREERQDEAVASDVKHVDP